MNRSGRWFWTIVAAQAAMLFAWAGYHEHVRSNAPVVRLKTVPVDPRDLLRGDYMILRYEISNVKLPDADARNHGQDTSEYWVVLEPREGYHVAVSASHEKPSIRPDQLLILGTASARGGLDYGIENYFVPEGKGTPRARKVEVEAAVSSSHRLQLKRVLVDGRPYP